MDEVLVTAWSTLTYAATSVVDSVRPHVWWLGLSALASGGLWGWWRRRASLALGSRTAVDLVPAAGFDPSMEAIERHVARLARVPAAAGWLPRRASAVRMRHGSTGAGKLATRLEGPESAAGLLRLPSFPDIDVLEAGRGGGQVRPIHFTNVAPLGANSRQES